MAARRLTVALLANLKKNAPHLPGEASDAHDDLDSERTVEALKGSIEAAGYKTPLEFLESVYRAEDD